jgi:hypothetical protein
LFIEDSPFFVNCPYSTTFFYFRLNLYPVLLFPFVSLFLLSKIYKLKSINTSFSSPSFSSSLSLFSLCVCFFLSLFCFPSYSALFFIHPLSLLSSSLPILFSFSLFSFRFFSFTSFVSTVRCLFLFCSILFPFVLFSPFRSFSFLLFVLCFYFGIGLFLFLSSPFFFLFCSSSFTSTY